MTSWSSKPPTAFSNITFSALVNALTTVKTLQFDWLQKLGSAPVVHRGSHLSQPVALWLMQAQYSAPHFLGRLNNLS
jgi:hypothetical protein